MATFVHKKRLAGTVISISENLGVKGQGHQMTKYGQKSVLELKLYFNVPGSSFGKAKAFNGAVLKSKSHLEYHF